MNANDPAFPTPPSTFDVYGNDNKCPAPGMTIREHMATIICAGICANPDISRAGAAAGLSVPEFRPVVATAAVHQADALIAALDKIKP